MPCAAILVRLLSVRIVGNRDRVGDVESSIGGPRHVAGFGIVVSPVDGKITGDAFDSGASDVISMSSVGGRFPSARRFSNLRRKRSDFSSKSLRRFRSDAISNSGTCGSSDGSGDGGALWVSDDPEAHPFIAVHLLDRLGSGGGVWEPFGSASGSANP